MKSSTPLRSISCTTRRKRKDQYLLELQGMRVPEDICSAQLSKALLQDLDSFKALPELLRSPLVLQPRHAI